MVWRSSSFPHLPLQEDISTSHPGRKSNTIETVTTTTTRTLGVTSYAGVAGGSGRKNIACLSQSGDEELNNIPSSSVIARQPVKSVIALSPRKFIPSSNGPSKKFAILFPSKKNTQLKDYVYAVGALLGGGEGITHASRLANERICIYLKSEQVVENFMAKHGGISSQDEFILARRFQSKVQRLLISNVPPEVRNEDLIDLIQQAVTVVSPISEIPIGSKKQGYEHINCFRRQVYVMKRDQIVLPDSVIIELDKTHHRIFLELDELKCFKCKQAAHIVKNCPKRVEEQTEKSLIARDQLTATSPSSQSTADTHTKGVAEKESNATTENQEASVNSYPPSPNDPSPSPPPSPLLTPTVASEPTPLSPHTPLASPSATDHEDKFAVNKEREMREKLSGEDEIIRVKDRYRLINVYIPRDPRMAESVLRAVDNHILTFSQNDIILMGGDYNTTLSPVMDRTRGVERYPRISQQLKAIVNKYNLADVWREVWGMEPGYTYTGNAPYYPKARLDRFYLSLSKIHKISCVKNIPSFSDHCALLTSVSMQEMKSKTSLWRLNLDYLEIPEFDKGFDALIRQMIENRESYKVVLHWWDMPKLEVKEIAIKISRWHKRRCEQEMTFLEKGASEEGRNTSLIQWYRKESEEIIAVHDIESRLAYDTPAGPKLTKETKKKAFIPLECLRIGDRIVKDRKQMCRYITEHFQTKFSTHSGGEPEETDVVELGENSRAKCDQDVTVEELTYALHSLNKGKAPGGDGIPCEFYLKY
ncbi:hypothetical protein J437_LFUL007202 [Ladona fulva]|uniref:CCHC-type domain-containing protein n=1 Tax=Ladona fulva TaxID=123851 RepID=A0A8K0P0B9_LADFU|nr:hypothetical protein J437_LFUL007202 [Ladona fulva]